MRPLQLVLLTRRYWPQVGGAEMVMARLAAQFQQAGVEVCVLTAQWESHWPTDLVHRGARVTRIANPRARGWGTYRYMRGIARWLRTHRDQFDLVYVSMLKHDAYAALGALRSLSRPVVLRAEGSGETGDCAWHLQARFGPRIRQRCQTAQAVVAPSDDIAAELQAAEFNPQQIHRIDNGVPVPDLDQLPNSAESRRALADGNRDLQVKPNAPVVLYTGRLHEAKGLFDLVRAWPQVLKRWPQARLWMVGEGPAGPALWDLAKELHLQGALFLPGAYDEVVDLLIAADLFVLPSYHEGMSISLLEAMASGTPVVASDISANRKLVQHREHGLLFRPGSVEGLAAAMIRQIEHAAQARDWAAQARRRVETSFSLEQMVREHLSLFEQLCPPTTTGARDRG